MRVLNYVAKNEREDYLLAFIRGCFWAFSRYDCPHCKKYKFDKLDELKKRLMEEFVVPTEQGKPVAEVPECGTLGCTYPTEHVH